MKTDFDVHIHVDLGVTPELVALVNAVISHRQMPTVQTAQPASEQPEAPAPKPKRGRKAAEPEPEPQPEAEAPEVTEQTTDGPEPQPEAEAPANDAAGDQPEPEAETPTDQPEDENGESQEITAGDVGSVEDLVDFAPAEETE